jgi:hypothetical protein
MAVLPDAWLLVLNALLEAPVAWQSPAEIGAAIGRGEEEVTDLLCDLDLAGWLSVWETESGPLVTLSALAAERLCVRLVEIGAAATLRWARAGDPDPPPVRSKNVCLSERAASLEYVADPGLSPDLAAERGERAEARARGPHTDPAAARATRREEPPRPTLLVGLSLTPWPGPREAPESACPACRGRTLGPQMYCLYCDRWGLDRPPLVAEATTTTVPVSPPARRSRRAPDPVTVEQAQTERFRARRKSKRRSRHLARLEADRTRGQKAAGVAPGNEPRPAFVPLSSPPPGKPPGRDRAATGR